MGFPKFVSKWTEASKIRKLKKDQLVIVLLFGVLLLVIAIPVTPEKTQAGADGAGQETEAEAVEEAASETASGSYERQQEERLAQLLSRVEGVGAVEVMLTLSASSEKIVEKDEPSTSQITKEADSSGGTRESRQEERTEGTIYEESEDGSRKPYVVQELKPKVDGAVIIAEGGGNAAVRQSILEAVQALYPVEAHRIKIMKMEGAQ